MIYPTVTMFGASAWEWRYVLGTKELPVLDPQVAYCTLGPNPEPTACYMLAVEALTTEQKSRLIDHLAQKFTGPREEVERQLLTIGVPIRASSVERIHVPEGWQRPQKEGPAEVFDLRMFT